MCGIIAYHAATKPRIDVERFMYDSLKRLEYRGYDSYGLVYFDEDKTKPYLHQKGVGRIPQVMRVSNKQVHTAIGHTRWATHGGVSIGNAHPVNSGDVWVAHNGEIENLREFQPQEGETDTQTLARYLDEHDTCEYPHTVLKETLDCMEGRNAVVIYYKGKLYAYANGLILYYAYVGNAVIVTSDLRVFHAFHAVKLFDISVSVVSGLVILEPPRDDNDAATFQPLEEPADYMLSEIEAQESLLLESEDERQQIASGSCLVGCGSSYNAALFVKHALPDKFFHAEYAVDYTNRPYYPEVVFISQSGHTVDVIDAIEITPPDKRVTLTNNPDSPIAQMLAKSFDMNAGPEYAVAATKTYLATVLFFLRSEGINPSPGLVKSVIDELTPDIQKIADTFKNAKNMLFLGDDLMYAVAKEAALKVKEVSYIHAESIRAAEVKHGPIALVDKDMPVFFFISKHDQHYMQRILSNVAQVESRGGKIVLVADSGVEVGNKTVLKLGQTTSLIDSAIKAVVVGQLLAFYLAKAKGLDCDRPRNLAKTVTVR